MATDDSLARSVTAPDYHLWTDALHARQLARETRDKWDRGTYVRWAIQSAWTSFEAVCESALETRRLGMRFKDRLSEAIQVKFSSPVDWSKGLWQAVLEIYQLRKDYGHPRVPQSRLFAEVEEADRAIEVLRDAVLDLFKIAGKPTPNWILDDQARGWQGRGGMRDGAHATVIRASVDETDPETIRIVYLYRGQEYVSEILSPHADHRAPMEKLVEEVVIPISEVRAYRGVELLDRIELHMRGS